MKEKVYDFPESDFEYKAFRTDSVGGQQVGLSIVRVRCEHIPTRIAAECESERSQHHNRRIAKEMVIHGVKQIWRIE